MLELLFSESAAAALKIAKSLKGGDLLSTGLVTTVGAQGETLRWEPSRPAPYNGPEMDGDSRDVLGIWLGADIGDISNLEDWSSRAALWRSICEGQGEESGWVEDYTRLMREAVSRLRGAAEGGEPVRVWWSDAPGEACGYAWVMWLLRSAPGAVSGVKLPFCLPGEEGLRRVRHTGELSPEDFPGLLPLERPVEPGERTLLAGEWERLRVENAPLRAVVNGELRSVPADFYDDALRAAIPPGECLIADILGRALVEGPPGIGDGWYYRRILHLLETGELLRLRTAARPYFSLVRRA